MNSFRLDKTFKKRKASELSNLCNNHLLMWAFSQGLPSSINRKQVKQKKETDRAGRWCINIIDNDFPIITRTHTEPNLRMSTKSLYGDVYWKIVNKCMNNKKIYMKIRLWIYNQAALWGFTLTQQCFDLHAYNDHANMMFNRVNVYHVDHLSLAC